MYLHEKCIVDINSNMYINNIYKFLLVYGVPPVYGVLVLCSVPKTCLASFTI